jgi:hypothetical protein
MAYAYVLQQSDKNYSRTSEHSDSPWYDNEVQTALASIPGAADTIDLAGGSVIVDMDISPISISDTVGNGVLYFGFTSSLNPYAIQTNLLAPILMAPRAPLTLFSKSGMLYAFTDSVAYSTTDDEPIIDGDAVVQTDIGVTLVENMIANAILPTAAKMNVTEAVTITELGIDIAGTQKNAQIDNAGTATDTTDFAGEYIVTGDAPEETNDDNLAALFSADSLVIGQELVAITDDNLAALFTADSLVISAALVSITDDNLAALFTADSLVIGQELVAITDDNLAALMSADYIVQSGVKSALTDTNCVLYATANNGQPIIGLMDGSVLGSGMLGGSIFHSDGAVFEDTFYDVTLDDIVNTTTPPGNYVVNTLDNNVISTDVEEWGIGGVGEMAAEAHTSAQVISTAGGDWQVVAASAVQKGVAVGISPAVGTLTGVVTTGGVVHASVGVTEAQVSNAVTTYYDETGSHSGTLSPVSATGRRVAGGVM